MFKYVFAGDIHGYRPFSAVYLKSLCMGMWQLSLYKLRHDVMLTGAVYSLQVLDKLEGGQDIHGADIALKRHEAIRTDVGARVSGWGGEGVVIGRRGQSGAMNWKRIRHIS